MADAGMKTNFVFVLPVGLARLLQKDVAAGNLWIGAMCKKIEKSLVRKEMPKP